MLNAKAIEIESELPDITNLATKTTLNAKAVKIKKKIPGITNLDTKIFLNTKPRRLKAKYLIPKVSLLLLKLID